MKGSWNLGITVLEDREIRPVFKKYTGMIPIFLFLKKELRILSVTLFLQVLLGDELKGCRVDAIAESRGLRSICEYVAKMGITMFAPHFRPRHEKSSVFPFDDVLWFQRLGKAWPPRSGIEFVDGTE